MNTITKVVSTVTALLVTGAGLAVAAPASSATPIVRKTMYSGVAVITLDKSLKKISKAIVVDPPAKKDGNHLSFPVVGVEGNGIMLAGGTRAGTNPVITTKDDGTATMTISVGGRSVEIFTITGWNMRDTSKKGKITKQRWSGDVHLTRNQIVVDTMNAGFGKPIFQAGQAFGEIDVTIKLTRG